MSFRGSSGLSGGFSTSRNDQTALIKQETGATTKQLNDATQLIERELDHDEKREEVLDELQSNETGYYHFEKNRLQLRRTVPIPQAIIDQYDHLECKSYVGLMPEIHRAFITIDNKLFLWNYYDGSDFYLYDELSQIIISVALLRPKPGVFVESIQHILVLSTPVEILMFAVKFDGDNVHNSLHLFPTQFTVPSDNVHMTSIIGTEQGRIFLCGRDGGVYELDYWSGDNGWFGGSRTVASVPNSASSGILSLPFSSLFTSQRKKCRKVNHSSTSFKLLRSILPGFLGGTGSMQGNTEQHVESIVYDSSRNFLYTLVNEAGGRGSGIIRPVVAVYELGPEGRDMKLKSQLDDVSESCKIALKQTPADMYADLPAELRIVTLSAIPVHESPTILLMAVTSHGHRLYFSLEPRSERLRVKFVRLCPPAITPEELHRGTAGSGQVARTKVEPRYAKGTSPSLVHRAYYKDGILLLADAGRSSLGDSLVSIHKDPRPAASTANANQQSWLTSHQLAVAPAVLNEAVDSFDFDSRICDVGEVHQAAVLNVLSYALHARPSAQGGLPNAKYTPVTASRFSPDAIKKPLYGLPELATQHLTPNRQLLVLTSSSLLTMTKIRPLDELRHALSVKKRTNDEGALNAFLARYGAKEACAMCLVLIGAANATGTASAPGMDDEVERRGFLHGGSTTLSVASPNKLLGSPAATNTGGVSEDQLRKGAKQAFFRFGESIGPNNTTTASSAAKASSPKLESVALYMSRWIRAHWDWSLCLLQPVHDVTGVQQQATLQFRFGREFYIELLQPLLKLQKFLEENQRLLIKDFGLNGQSVTSSSASYGASSGLADPARLESENFHALSALLNLTIEVLNLLVLFLSTPAPSFATGGGANPSGARDEIESASLLLRSSPFLSSADLQNLKEMKFYDLLSNPDGHALVKKLINTLAYVGAGSANSLAMRSLDTDVTMSDSGSARSNGTRTPGSNKRSRPLDGQDAQADQMNQLISRLHQACPTFFGSSDLLYYNALDSLKHAKQHWNLLAERNAHIQRALKTYLSFLASPTFPLEDVADKLKGVYEYSGIVELAMRRAELLERREIPKPKVGSLAGTVAPGREGAHLTDQEYYDLQRRKCFHVILDTMNILMFGVAAGKSLASTTGASGSTANGSGSTSAERGVGTTTVTIDSSIPPLSPDQLSASRDRVVSQILSSQDPDLHRALYTWYIQQELYEELYSIQSDHLLKFLTSSESYILTLKDYYLRNEKWHEASLLLNYLSLKKGPEYTLRDRVDFLTRALHCARNYQNQLQKFGGASPHGNQGGRLGGAQGKRVMERSGGVGASASTPLHHQPSLADQQDFIDQLKDRIEISKIQIEIYNKLELLSQETYGEQQLQFLEERKDHAAIKAFQEKRESLLNALAELDASLLDLQALYLFCTNFGLWECCLLIFKFSNESQRSDVICALWKNIFRSCMAECKRAGIDWSQQVQDKFVELASGVQTNYKEIEYCFPLEFIVKELEVNNFKYRSEPSEDYVSQTLLRAGIAPYRLLHTYDTMLENWEQQSTSDSTHADANMTNAHGQTIQPFLYWSVWFILKTVMEQERTSRRSSSSSSSAAALNLFNKCLTNLRTLPPSETTTRLARKFQQLYDEFLKQTR